MPVARALRLISAHNAVTGVTIQQSEPAGDVVALVEIKTELPSDWRAVGASPSGVHVTEPVTFRFSRGYPALAPQIRLRSDFDRSHPHIQPGSANGLPEPCLSAGSPRELLRLRGILGLVEQLADWLDKAATLDLIDPKQGWEPVRRDLIDDYVICESGWLKALVRRDGGCAALKVTYVNIDDEWGRTYWISLKPSQAVAFGPELAGEFTFRKSETLRLGNGVALVAWPDKNPDGSPFVAGRYLPETVTTVAELLERSAILGCRAHLEPKLRLLQERFRNSQMKVSVPLAVILLARRPYPVIGGDGSVYELCPYVVELNGQDNLSDGSHTIVRPAMHREDISSGLLRRVSGDMDATQASPWSLIGCGSVGSKLALHMARIGRGPSSLIDRASMMPHNYGRHALYPASSGAKYGLLGTKAVLLKDALADLGSTPAHHTLDVVNLMTSRRSLDAVIAEDCFAVVNTTGSATVRETLGSAAYSGKRPRIIEACLLGAGEAGLMTVEGQHANPSTTDLICEAYLEIHRRPELATHIFGTVATEVAVGQGCSSLTMPLRDSKLSLFVAAMGEKLFHLQTQGLPSEGGLLLLGSLGADGISQSWTEKRIGPRVVVGAKEIEIRISPEVDQAIREEVARKPNSETGGIIFGRYCDVSSHFHIVGTLPAPPDSKFSKEEFVLGTKGLRAMLRALIQGSGGALYPLGTWHNHLVPSGPSAKDMRTAILLSGLQYFPLLMLIHTPGGYSFLTAETVSAATQSSGEAAEAAV